MKSINLALCALLLTSAAALGHGNSVHVKGTVSRIERNTITVATTTGESKTVSVDMDTRFLKSGITAKLNDLKVGDRVVIHAKPKGAILQAVEVRFGKPPKPSPTQQ